MNRGFDILIVGGGMVGLATAALLTRIDGLRITLVDAGPMPSFEPADDVSLRVSSVAPGSIAMLDAVGAWQDILAARACPFRDMKVWDAFGSADGPETLVFDSAEFAVPHLGFIVENNLVQTAMLNCLSGTRAELRFESPIETIDRAGRRFQVTFSSGDSFAPDLLIGADGTRSMIRSSAGIAVRSWPHAQKAFVTVLSPELSHCNTAWQRFLKNGPIGLLPRRLTKPTMRWRCRMMRSPPYSQTLRMASSVACRSPGRGARFLFAPNMQRNMRRTGWSWWATPRIRSIHLPGRE